MFRVAKQDDYFQSLLTTLNRVFIIIYQNFELLRAKFFFHDL